MGAITPLATTLKLPLRMFCVDLLPVEGQMTMERREREEPFTMVSMGLYNKSSKMTDFGTSQNTAFCNSVN